MIDRHEDDVAELCEANAFKARGAAASERPRAAMMIKATELLEQNPKPSDEDIKTAFTTSGPSAHLCRCGSYLAILEGVRHAVSLMAKKDGGA